MKDSMQRRFMVIADYPYSPYRINDIITMPENSGSFHLTTTSYRDEFGECVYQNNYSSLDNILKYPHLFRELSWWEGLRENEMPEYISYVSLTLKDRYGNDESKTRIYLHITKWTKNNKGIWYYNGSIYNEISDLYQPSTLEQYTEYINSIK